MDTSEPDINEKRRLAALELAIGFCVAQPTEDREIEIVKIAKVFTEFLKGDN